MNQYKPIHKQLAYVISILKSNDIFLKILQTLKNSIHPAAYIGGGSIPQMFWNKSHGFDLNNDIKDFNIVYYDRCFLEKGLKFMKAKEHEYEKDLRIKLAKVNFEIDVTNEALVHLWYPKRFGIEIDPYKSTEDAISSFPTTASSIGARLNKQEEIEIFAPFGFYDLLSQIVRANKRIISRDVFERKASKWSKKWSKLKIIPWSSKS